MPPFEDDTHATLAQPPLELIAAIEDRLARDRMRRSGAIVRAIRYFVGVTVTAGWTLSHALVLLLHRARAGQDVARKILAATVQASKHDYLDGLFCARQLRSGPYLEHFFPGLRFASQEPENVL